MFLFWHFIRHEAHSQDSRQKVSILKSAAEHPLSCRRILTGLLGAPIAHSASPVVHERAAEALGSRCHYQLIEVAGARREAPMSH
jgi:hypothetical protein